MLLLLFVYVGRMMIIISDAQQKNKGATPDGRKQLERPPPFFKGKIARQDFSDPCGCARSFFLLVIDCPFFCRRWIDFCVRKKDFAQVNQTQSKGIVPFFSH